MTRIVVNPEATMAFAEGSGAVFRLNAGPMGAGSGAPQAKKAKGQDIEPTDPQKRYLGFAFGDMAPWGDDNLFPQQVLADMEKNTILPSVLERKTAIMYGEGIVYGIVEGFDADGNEVFKRQSVPEIDEFIRRTRLNRYGFEALHDINVFGNAFPELILSKDRKKIVGISAQEAIWCRYQKPQQGKFQLVYINANWDYGGHPDDEYTTKVPIIDPYYDAVGNLQARTDSFKYIYPLSVPSPDKAFYQLASWNSVRRSGWLDVMAAIPEFKKMLFKNQLSIKYMVTIHHLYWDWKYGDWEGKTLDERRGLIEAELKAFNDVLAGTNGAGKTLMTTTIRNAKGEDIEAFKVAAIDDKLKDGLYIEDSAEAASHVYTAVGVAPALMGVSPGKGMGGGAGGGSEPRVMFNNLISTVTFHQSLVLEPLELIAAYNGWDPRLKWRFQIPKAMSMSATLNAQQETK
ncbi:hypothetical protein [Hymenobacter rubidus]|uniref:hypothetical protein n=1 Tax=Hymenobacter rubidus TaxID=1441626 RepID=UPI00191E46BA|nr:hypothetical protein [Hymenobacter rubidus]